MAETIEIIVQKTKNLVQKIEDKKAEVEKLKEEKKNHLSTQTHNTLSNTKSLVHYLKIPDAKNLLGDAKFSS